MMINILKKREYPKKINRLVIASVIFLMSITYYLSSSLGCLYAYSTSDYCWKYSLEITNNTGSILSHQPVLLSAVDMDYWQDQNYIDQFGWSIFPYQSSLATEYNVMLQDINNTASNQ